jgi:hypothetical protein
MAQKFLRDDCPPSFVVSLKAGGTGLTLTAATILTGGAEKFPHRDEQRPPDFIRFDLQTASTSAVGGTRLRWPLESATQKAIP